MAKAKVGSIVNADFGQGPEQTAGTRAARASRGGTPDRLAATMKTIHIYRCA